MLDAIFKIVIFGDAGSGKTSLMKRFKTDMFISDSQMTIGVDFETKNLAIDSVHVKLMVWDFAGEERFRFIFPKYIRGAMGGILLYDITNYASLSHAYDWLSLMNGAHEQFPIILSGAKTDLEVSREVTFDEGLKFARSMDLDDFIECSSKTGENIGKLFETLTKKMLNIAFTDK